MAPDLMDELLLSKALQDGSVPDKHMNRASNFKGRDPSHKSLPTSPKDERPSDLADELLLSKAIQDGNVPRAVWKESGAQERQTDLSQHPGTDIHAASLLREELLSKIMQDGHVPDQVRLLESSEG